MSTLPVPAASWPPWADYVWWFMRRCMVRQAGTRVDLADVYGAFMAWRRDWWSDPAIEQPTPRQFAAAIAALCEAQDVRIELDADRVYCCDCRLLHVA